MVSLGSCPSPGGQTASTMALVLKTKRKSSLKPVSLATLVLLTSTLVSAAPPTLQIPRIATPPSLSDFEDMQPSARVNGQMVKVTGFIARDPADGAEPTQNTDVYLAYDQHNRSEEHTSELQSRGQLVCRLLLENKKDSGNRHR